MILRDRYAIGLEQFGFSRTRLNDEKRWLYKKGDTCVWLSVRGNIRIGAPNLYWTVCPKMSKAQAEQILKAAEPYCTKSAMTSVVLPESTISSIRDYGNGNFTQGIRLLAKLIPK